MARRLRLLQLPRVRPRSRDHRGGPQVPRAVGHAPELVAHARQPRSLRADRGAADRAARLRGRARDPDDHAHPLLGDSGARGRRHDLRRQPRAQDDLRRLSVRIRARGDRQEVPLRGSARPRAAAAPGPLDDAADLYGRGQQHDRQRTGPEGLRATRAPLRRDALRRRRTRLRRDRRALARRAEPVRPAGKQRRALLRRDVRPDRARRRVLEGVLVARRLRRLPDRSQGAAQDGGASLPLLRAVAGRLPRHRPGRVRGQRDARRRRAPRPVAQDGPDPAVPRPAGHPHAEPVGVPDHRGAAGASRGHRRGRALPLRARRLRDARRVPARPEERGRLPHPGNRREHSGRDRAAGRRARKARQCVRPAAGATGEYAA